LSVASHWRNFYTIAVKTVTSITLITLYSLFTVGITVLVHTCGGYRTVNVMPVSLEDPCGCNDADSDEPCCTLDVKTVHLEDDHQATPAVTLVSLDFTIQDFPHNTEIPHGDHVVSPVPVDTSPPFSPPLTILHSTLLI
jgi:hypothetical protein